MRQRMMHLVSPSANSKPQLPDLDLVRIYDHCHLYTNELGPRWRRRVMVMDLTETGTAADDKIRCDACPVMCYIKSGALGACDRYANVDGELVRVDPHVVLDRRIAQGGEVVPFANAREWDGDILHQPQTFVTGIGAGTTYPDYKPAPFIVSREIEGVDMVTVVTEGIFSYCGVKVKIDTDRHVGPEQAAVRAGGEQVGHVTTAEYGSQMLSLGGVRHLTGGSKKEGVVTCDTMLALCNAEAVRNRHRWRRRDHRAGRSGAHRRRGYGGANAGGLRLGHHRHVRQAVARARRRSDRRRRSHHRSPDRTPGRHAAST